MSATAASKDEGGSRKKDKENDSITKHYPWLASFDEEAKAYLAAPEVTVAHVFKLLTLLESHVSPEVSKLKTRPNRATKFLTQIRKKISLVKMSGYMIETGSEKDLFPTYGLLLTHVVNISLVSSKVERLGAQAVATELYYFLKLMFQGDNEYILDVALCSNLDEHASSKKTVGFQLFSFIVEDWRLYADTDSSKMKYCAIGSLLAATCQAGQEALERNVPTTEKPSKNFIHFLRESGTLDNDFGIPAKTQKVNNLKAIISHVKPTSVKSISRSRLVVVSKRNITGRRQKRSGSSESSTTSTVNLPTTSHSSSVGSQREIPSSSSSSSVAVYSRIEDPMNQILGELGLGGGFYLDTTGHDIDVDGYYDDPAVTDYMNQNDHVSSSSTRAKSSSPEAEKGAKKRKSKAEEDSEEDTLTFEKGKSFRYSSPYNYDSPNSMVAQASSPPRRRSNDPVEVADNEPSKTRRVSKISEKEEEEEDGVMSDGSREGAFFESDIDEKEDDYENNSEGSLMSLDVDAKEPEPDSDLEVLAVVDVDEGEKDNASVSSDGSRSRDEAEAESGEDVVPNYDVDSDLEENSVGGSPPEDAAATNTKAEAGQDSSSLENKNENKKEECEEEKTEVVGATTTASLSENIDENTEAEKSGEEENTTVTLNSEDILFEAVNVNQEESAVTDNKDETKSTSPKKSAKSPVKGKKQAHVEPEDAEQSESPSPSKRTRLSRVSTRAQQQKADLEESTKSPNSESNAKEVSATPTVKKGRPRKKIAGEATEPTPVRRSSRLHK